MVAMGILIECVLNMQLHLRHMASVMPELVWEVCKG